MDRKGKIAVIISVLLLVAWQVWVVPKIAPRPQPAAGGAAASPAAAAASATPILSAGVAAAATPAQQNVPEQATEIDGLGTHYQFTNHGGGIARAELTGYPALSGSNVDLNEFGSVPIGGISEKPGQGGDAAYTVTRAGNVVTCVRQEAGGVTISKKFTIADSIKDAHGYRVRLDVTMANGSGQPFQSSGYYVYVGSAGRLAPNEMANYTAFDWDAGGRSQHVETNWFDPHRAFLIGPESPAQESYAQDVPETTWAAVSSQYFTNVITVTGSDAAAGVWATRFPIKVEGRNPYAMEGAIRMPAFSLPAGGSVTHTFDLYLGPKLFAALESLGRGQERIVSNYFSLYGMSAFRPVSVLLLNAMNLLHSWTRNYALAIIIMTLMIRGALWPLQNKATASMRQMQELQPRMNELKAKYESDPTRMNTEVMKLYKEYNVNPLSGCLPMFVQIPIFFGFYRMLGTAVELRGSHFLWVKDLSQPDTVLHLIGYPVNILPICMAVTMVFQMSMTPKTGDQAQQRMFMFMPLIFVMFCYNFAAALALYWTVGNIFSIFQLYVTRKRTAPAPLKAAARRKSR